MKERILYRIEYSERERTGFTSFKNEKGEFVYGRVVEIEFLKWDAGYYMKVNILDITANHLNEDLETVVYSRNIYDSSNEMDSEFRLVARTYNQERMINAIGCGNLRGLSACEFVYELYIDLVVLNDKFGLDKYLPKVVEFYKRLRQAKNGKEIVEAHEALDKEVK